MLETENAVLIRNLTTFVFSIDQVHIQSPLIMNGVCVRWRGWIDAHRLDGVACLEFDERSASVEEAMLREQIKRYDQLIIKEMEEKNRLFKETANSQLCKLYSQ